MSDTPTSIRIGLLEVGQYQSDLAAKHGTFAEWFIPFLDKSGRQIDYRTYQVFTGEMPENISECDAWLVTGSEVSTYDNTPWQAPLGTFLKQAAEISPVIGICYGHQLLHHIYGGSIKKSPKGWGIGVQEYQIANPRSWMAPASERIRLLISHQDQVVAPAPGSDILGGSEFCPVGISVIGDNILTMQPHPELKRDLADLVFRMRNDEQGHDVTNAALSTMEDRIDDAMVALWILSFIENRLCPGESKTGR